jgi:AraC family transcriptional activator of pobA
MIKKFNYENIGYSGRGLPFSYSISKRLSEDHTGELSEPRWHEQLEIKYMISGTAEITCGPKIFIAEAGDIVLINPCERHAIRAPYGTDPIYHILMADATLGLGDTVKKLKEIADGTIRFNNLISENNEVKEILLSLFRELQTKDSVYELYSFGCAAQLFAALIRSELAPEQTALSDAVRLYAERLEPAFRLISTDYPLEITLENLADVCGISRYYFCRLYKIVTGKTAMSYINEFRINKAELLLRSTDMPISEITAAVGMPDECYFSRCFKRHKGIPPSSCRNKARKNAVSG